MNGLLNGRVVDKLLRIQMQRIGLVTVVATQIAARQEGNNLPFRLRVELLRGVHTRQAQRKLVHVESLRNVESAAHHKRLHGRIAATLRFAAGNLSEEHTELRVQQGHIPTTEDLRDEGSLLIEHAGRNTERRQQKLALHVHVHVMETRHVWRSIANNQLRLAAIEVVNNLVRSGFGGDVTLNLNNALNGSHFLQINGNNLGFFISVNLVTFQLPAQHLAPATWSGAEIDRPVNVYRVKYGK